MADVELNVDSGKITAETSRWPVEWLVCFIGFTTCMAVAAAIYKVPSGVFDGYRLAYYAFVASAGVIGFGEVCVAAFWMSGSGVHHRPHSSLARRCVLCASFLPMAFIAGLGGVRILVK